MTFLIFAAGFVGGIAAAFAWRKPAPSEFLVKQARQIVDAEKRREKIIIETVETITNTAPETVQAVACYDNRVSFDLRGEFPEEVKTAVRKLADAFDEHSQF